MQFRDSVGDDSDACSRRIRGVKQVASKSLRFNIRLFKAGVLRNLIQRERKIEISILNEGFMLLRGANVFQVRLDV